MNKDEIKHLLGSVKHNGLVDGLKSSHLRGLPSRDRNNLTDIGTVILNPEFTKDRLSYKNEIPDYIFNSVELSDSNDVFNWDTNTYVYVDVFIGGRKHSLLFRETASDDKKIEQFLKAPSEFLQEAWLQQVLYHRNIGMLNISLERPYLTRNAERPELEERAISNVVYVMDIDRVKDKVTGEVACQGEVKLSSPISEKDIIYIIAPCHIASIVRGVGFSPEMIEVPLVRKTLEYHFECDVPNYESALRAIIVGNDKQFLAHIMRLPTETDMRVYYRR